MNQSHGINAVPALKVHVSLNVRDIARSIEFYRTMLGIEPSKVRTGYAKFDVQSPPINLALNEVADLKERGALSHLGIQVASTEAVLAVREQWIAAGLVTRDEMKTDCCYATQDKTWVSDPDGNGWEVFVVLQDNLPETENSTSCCTTTKAVVGEAAIAGATTAAEASGCGCAA
ncbi:MAG TPA: ArsI/CadI family heavy metal resistance metalloenzyme [Thermoanaerobaculia bacterium]|nr:ArsI/CadI family heavy metal resistance metalloenzyme [Thermoanaerobaculia bacterium]